jgi:hypothetical protein
MKHCSACKVKNQNDTRDYKIKMLKHGSIEMPNVEWSNLVIPFTSFLHSLFGPRDIYGIFPLTSNLKHFLDVADPFSLFGLTKIRKIQIIPFWTYQKNDQFLNYNENYLLIYIFPRTDAFKFIIWYFCNLPNSTPLCKYYVNYHLFSNSTFIVIYSVQ